MPYSKQHKQETRERILEAAAAALREAGINGVGIGELMARAGLTHGGFYAHFPSKDALVAQACLHGLAASAEQILPNVEASSDWPRDDAQGAAKREALRVFIRAYLSRNHRDNATTGCMLPTLAADVARSSDDVRTAFTEGLQAYADRLAALLPDEQDGDRGQGDEALVMLSSLAGAVLLARAVNDPQLSDRILLAARHFYGAAFTKEHAQAGEQNHTLAEQGTDLRRDSRT